MGGGGTMARTDEKVSYSPTGRVEDVTPEMAAAGVSAVLKIIEGRWKMIILFHLFSHPVMRFSALERAIPAVSQKMLGQQLRELERDGMVARTVHPQVPPKVEYALTARGRAICPALDALLDWSATTGGGPLPSA